MKLTMPMCHVSVACRRYLTLTGRTSRRLSAPPASTTAVMIWLEKYGMTAVYAVDGACIAVSQSGLGVASAN